MKKYIILFVSMVALFSFNTYNNRVDDLLKELGIPVSDANNHIWRAFAIGYSSFSSNKAIRNYPQNKRAAVVEALGSYVKSYLVSRDFAKQYQVLREEKRPQKPSSVEQRLKLELANLYRSLKEAEDGYRKSNPELKSVYEESIRKYRQSINALENDYDPQHPAQIEGILIQYDYDMDDYRFRIKKFEKEYPADVKLFIRNRLQDFLMISSTVDFGAELINKSGVKKFANPDYENSSQIWKFCFRAGKGATTSARRLATQWLKEI